MKCPVCHQAESRVIRTMDSRRRRECVRCRTRWWTQEVPAEFVAAVTAASAAAKQLATLTPEG